MLASILIVMLAFESALQLFPAVLPERHEYMARRVANQNLRGILDFVHRDEPHVHHQPSDTFRYHPILGWTSTPGLDRVIWGYDGYFRVQTNSLGFRDLEVDRGRDRAPDPDRGQIGSGPRVLVLGDSFVWGLFLDQEQLMPQQLEMRLGALGHRVEVHNFGMAGYGNDQELLALREFGARVEPSVVVLAFFYSNDFEDNARASSRWRGGRAKPYFELTAAGALELRNVPVPEPKTTLIDKPPQRLAGHSRQLRQRSVLASLAGAALREGQREGQRDPSSRRPVSAGASPEAIDARRITRAILLEIEREVTRRDAELVVALFPGYGYSVGRRDEYLRAAEFFERELPQIDLVDLTEAFDRSDRPLHGRFVEHWNADGSRLAAEVIADHLVRHHAARLRNDRG